MDFARFLEFERTFFLDWAELNVTSNGLGLDTLSPSSCFLAPRRLTEDTSCSVQSGKMMSINSLTLSASSVFLVGPSSLAGSFRLYTTMFFVRALKIKGRRKNAKNE